MEGAHGPTEASAGRCAGVFSDRCDAAPIEHSGEDESVVT